MLLPEIFTLEQVKNTGQSETMTVYGHQQGLQWPLKESLVPPVESRGALRGTAELFTETFHDIALTVVHPLLLMVSRERLIYELRGDN